jgi:hypothetical protein
MGDFDDAIKRQSPRPLRGPDNQIVRYMMERFVARGRFIPAAWRWAGYLATGFTLAATAVAAYKAFIGP